jgi:hypothetical protein
MYGGTSADYSSLAIDISDISLDDEHMCLGSDDESLPNKPPPGPMPLLPHSPHRPHTTVCPHSPHTSMCPQCLC